MDELKNITIRNAKPSDHQNVIAAMPHWWDGRDLSASVQKIFFRHFSNTSFIAEKNSELCGFLVGFLSQSYPNEGYIHFVGVHPGMRKIGLAQSLYQNFYEVCVSNSRTIVKSCTSPINKLSIGFHQSMGFSIEPGDSFVDGMPVTINHFKENDPKVLFKKELST